MMTHVFQDESGTEVIAAKELEAILNLQTNSDTIEKIEEQSFYLLETAIAC